MSVFTHDYKFELDGAVFDGEAEFDEDGEMSYKPTGTNPALNLPQSQVIWDLFRAFKNVYSSFDEDIVMIRLKKKVV